LASDLNYLIKGVNDMRKEIDIVEKINENKDLYDEYLDNLINFASDAVDDLEKLNDLFEDLNSKIIVFAEKMGEKKNTKLRELLLPLTSFLRCFKN
jgi:Zn-dependent M32 family carboxypeptidase